VNDRNGRGASLSPNLLRASVVLRLSVGALSLSCAPLSVTNPSGAAPRPFLPFTTHTQAGQIMPPFASHIVSKFGAVSVSAIDAPFSHIPRFLGLLLGHAVWQATHLASPTPFLSVHVAHCQWFGSSIGAGDDGDTSITTVVSGDEGAALGTKPLSKADPAKPVSGCAVPRLSNASHASHSSDSEPTFRYSVDFRVTLRTSRKQQLGAGWGRGGMSKQRPSLELDRGKLRESNALELHQVAFVVHLHAFVVQLHASSIAVHSQRFHALSERAGTRAGQHR